MALQRRLGDLPMTRQHYRIWWMASLGFFFEGIDLTIVGGILVVMSRVFHLSTAFVGVIGSTALAGYVVGVALAGWLGDRYGRKFVIMYTLLVFASLTIVSAASWNGIVFAILRFLVGIGVGGESAIVTPYLSEVMPAKFRGRLLGISDAMFTVGAIIAALINLFLIPAGSWGWRAALVVAGLPALYVWVIRKNLPESPVWLARHGRNQEAETVLAQLQPTPATQDTRSELSDREPETSAPRNTVAALWSRGAAHKTGALWTIWFFIELVYYGFLIWLPSLLVRHGYSIVKSLTYAFLINIAALIGGIIASVLQDTAWGRKAWIIVFFALSGLSSYFFAHASTSAAILTAASALSFLLNGLFSMLYTFTPEQYLSSYRSTGQGFASAVGHIGGVVGPLLVGATLTALGMTGVFGLFAIFLLVPIIGTLFLTETRAKVVQ